MKKVFSLIMTIVILACASVGVFAADANCQLDDGTGLFSIEYQNDKLVDGNPYGFVVVKGMDNQILDLSGNNFENILYIDEVVATGGAISLNQVGLKGKAPTEEGFTGATAFIGGKGFDSAEKIYAFQSNTIPVESVTLNKTAATIKVNETVLLGATITPSNATDKNVIWTSSDNTIATVDENGLVTGVKASATTVTITATVGDISATCTVTVETNGVRLPGDADGDGNVNIFDAVSICQYCAGQTITINRKNANVNGDKDVNIFDAVLICQFIAGQNVVLQSTDNIDAVPTTVYTCGTIGGEWERIKKTIDLTEETLGLSNEQVSNFNGNN